MQIWISVFVFLRASVCPLWAPVAAGTWRNWTSPWFYGVCKVLFRDSYTLFKTYFWLMSSSYSNSILQNFTQCIFRYRTFKSLAPHMFLEFTFGVSSSVTLHSWWIGAGWLPRWFIGALKVWLHQILDMASHIYCLWWVPLKSMCAFNSCINLPV